MFLVRSARTRPAHTRVPAAMGSCWRESATAPTWTSVKRTASGVPMSASTPSAAPTVPVPPATPSLTTTRRVKVCSHHIYMFVIHCLLLSVFIMLNTLSQSALLFL